MDCRLLDVNVLLALTWPNHVFHQAAHTWWNALTSKWATCAITELAFIRLSSNPAFTSAAVTTYEAASLLEKLTTAGRHEYWKELPRLNPGAARKIGGHKQVMDFYLANLAIARRARFVTFDHGISKVFGPVKIELLGTGG
jgi:uncharacterized protein